ncbi:hypothetical protein CHS0354_020084 [Potamilus streckersoni]|uniref:Uncharacterized protein n=1 Tax=Potamilus streckersoni TaxID=2493646 RepID=A0AAE0SCZ4_9BIVA|nr:hypothetical protein CHS0354_020084 [Potamilus streckersoni]
MDAAPTSSGTYADVFNRFDATVEMVKLILFRKWPRKSSVSDGATVIRDRHNIINGNTTSRSIQINFEAMQLPEDVAKCKSDSGKKTCLERTIQSFRGTGIREVSASVDI